MLRIRQKLIQQLLSSWIRNNRLLISESGLRLYDCIVRWPWSFIDFSSNLLLPANNGRWRFATSVSIVRPWSNFFIQIFGVLLLLEIFLREGERLICRRVAKVWWDLVSSWPRRLMPGQWRDVSENSAIIVHIYIIGRLANYSSLRLLFLHRYVRSRARCHIRVCLESFALWNCSARFVHFALL